MVRVLVRVRGGVRVRVCGRNGGKAMDDVCPVTGKADCADRECELHYMSAPLRLAPVLSHAWYGFNALWLRCSRCGQSQPVDEGRRHLYELDVCR